MVLDKLSLEDKSFQVDMVLLLKNVKNRQRWKSFHCSNGPGNKVLKEKKIQS
jgi:hypothetical protein